MDRVKSYVELAVLAWWRLGPYLLLEIVLPGGTLFALCLFAYRRRRQAGGSDFGPAWLRRGLRKTARRIGALTRARRWRMPVRSRNAASTPGA
jgi:hypothetical protein